MSQLITRFLLLFALFIRCTDHNSDIIILSNISEESEIGIPFEANIPKLNSDVDLFVAKSIDDPEMEFILQKSPSIFGSGNFFDHNSYSTILNKSVKNGKYIISPLIDKPSLRFEENKNGQLTVFEDNEPVLTYNFGMQLPKDVPTRYQRSSYIHPIYDLKGNVLTDDFPDLPKDHYHHRGVSWVWPKVMIDSVRYDLWHIYGIKGELEGIHQVFEKWIVKDEGPICATFGVKNNWMLDNGQNVMEEWVFIKVYRSNGNSQVIDIKLEFKANTLVILEGETKKGYGGLNFRFAPGEDTQITSKYSKEGDSNLKSMPWADQSAKFANNDYFSGASIFQHNTNHNFPAGWMLRHYGFLGVAWPGIEPYKMNSGETLSLHFRILIHQGNSEAGNVKKAYKVFNDGPKLKINN